MAIGCAVELEAIHGTARVVTSNSAVTVVGVEGEAYIKTSFALTRASEIQGPLTVESANGGIEAKQVAGGARLATTFGPVMLDGVGGSVEVNNQNGSVEASGLKAKAAGSGKCNPITVRTSFGPIRVHVPADGSYQVEARTTFGSVASELPITVFGTVNGGSITGKIGDGACELRLNDMNSSIEILKAP